MDSRATHTSGLVKTFSDKYTPWTLSRYSENYCNRALSVHASKTTGSVELFVGKKAVEKAAPWKSSKPRTFPLRLKIRQGQPDFHFSAPTTTNQFWIAGSKKNS